MELGEHQMEAQKTKQKNAKDKEEGKRKDEDILFLERRRWSDARRPAAVCTPRDARRPAAVCTPPSLPEKEKVERCEREDTEKQKIAKDKEDEMTKRRSEKEEQDDKVEREEE